MTNLPNPHGHACYWYDAAEKFGVPNVKWCEETLCQFITEPANFWSNITYLIVGFCIFYSARKQKSKDLMVLGIAVTIMGLGSGIYHLGNNYLFQVFDFVGMYLYLFWALVINLRRNGYLAFKLKYPSYVFFVVLFTAILHWLYLMGYKFQYIILIVAFMVAITEYRMWRKHFERLTTYKYFRLAVVTVVSGEIISILDANRIFCMPTNHFIQGHAIWHVLSGISCWFVYKHFSLSKKID